MAGWNTTEKLETASGATLALRKGEAQSKPRAIIHINHGMAEHSARYARFVEALNAAGYHAIGQDHRGHGATTAPDAPLGTFAARNGWQRVLEDCLAVNAHARQTWPGLPVIWFGHSMGGIIGTAFAARHSGAIDGSVLWNFSVDGGALISLLRTLILGERFFKGSDMPSRIATRLTFEDWNRKFKPNRTDFDWLSRDEAEVDRYVADPLCGFACSAALWLDVIEMIRIGASDGELAAIRNDLPVNLVGGEADPTSNHGKSIIRLAHRLNRAGIADISCKTLPGTRHETLNEINREEETRDLIAWLDARWG